MEEVDKVCSEFCITVGTVTRTASVLIHSRLKALAVNLNWPSGRLWLYAGLVRSKTALAGLQHHKENEFPCSGHCCLCDSFCLMGVSVWTFHLGSPGQRAVKRLCVCQTSKIPLQFAVSSFAMLTHVGSEVVRIRPAGCILQSRGGRRWPGIAVTYSICALLVNVSFCCPRFCFFSTANPRDWLRRTSLR